MTLTQPTKATITISQRPGESRRDFQVVIGGSSRTGQVRDGDTPESLALGTLLSGAPHDSADYTISKREHVSQTDGIEYQRTFLTIAPVTAAPASPESVQTGEAVEADGPEGTIYYVTLLRDRAQVAFVAGPYTTREQAHEMVEPARRLAMRLDPSTFFDAFGVTGVVPAPGTHRDGLLNRHLRAQVLSRA